MKVRASETIILFLYLDKYFRYKTIQRRQYHDEDTMVTFYDVLLACVSLRNRGLDSFGSLCGMKVFEPWWTG